MRLLSFRLDKNSITKNFRPFSKRFFFFVSLFQDGKKPSTAENKIRCRLTEQLFFPVEVFFSGGDNDGAFAFFDGYRYLVGD